MVSMAANGNGSPLFTLTEAAESILNCIQSNAAETDTHGRRYTMTQHVAEVTQELLKAKEGSQSPDLNLAELSVNVLETKDPQASNNL